MSNSNCILTKKNSYGFPLKKIGIIGGGQLAKMMAYKAKKMGFYLTILDPDINCSASTLVDNQIVGDFYNEEKIIELSNVSDVITYDIEHININILKELEKNGKKIYPSPKVLEIIQDKYIQKDFLSKNGIPVPSFKLFDFSNIEKIEKTVKQEKESENSISTALIFPFVQKARKGGYDGKGVSVIKSKNDLDKLLKCDSYIEELVDFEKELAVMVARNTKGEVKAYPVVEMAFDDRVNICDMVIAPANIDKEIEEKAKNIAIKCIDALDGVGIFGIELFLTKNREILVNEIAPRPHNSGHYTIESCVTCQFEQHIRAIASLPLGSTEILIPSVMINLLGDKDCKGEKPVIDGLDEILSIDGVSFHLYGKTKVKPFRKMGHITIVDKNINKALEKALKVKEIIKIRGE